MRGGPATARWTVPAPPPARGGRHTRGHLGGGWQKLMMMTYWEGAARSGGAAAGREQRVAGWAQGAGRHWWWPAAPLLLREEGGQGGQQARATACPGRGLHRQAVALQNGSPPLACGGWRLPPCASSRGAARGGRNQGKKRRTGHGTMREAVSAPSAQ